MPRTFVSFDKFLAHVEKMAFRAVEDAADFCLGRARHHAPVRKIFKGTLKKRTALFDKYSSPAGVAKQVIQRRSPSGVEGHANSNEPLFRLGNRKSRRYLSVSQSLSYGPKDQRAFIPERLSFRGVDTQGNLAKVIVTTERTGRGGRPYRPEDSADLFSAEPMLRTQGRYEVKAAKARMAWEARTDKQPGEKGPPLRGLFRPRKTFSRTEKARFAKRVGLGEISEAPTEEFGPPQIGGRLRDNLHVTGPTWQGNKVVAKVVSSVKDPDTGRMYGRDQEFGTVHHPPQPFLRPALHESRDALRKAAKRNLGVGPQSKEG